ncbi:MAG: hypothetical protein CMM07_26430 [Rhodopirellula sp.]|nr:hypothetical protein [Rhodopirellula sp.]
MLPEKPAAAEIKRLTHGQRNYEHHIKHLSHIFSLWQFNRPRPALQIPKFGSGMTRDTSFRPHESSDHAR